MAHATASTRTLLQALLAAALAAALPGAMALSGEPPEKVGATREVTAPPGRTGASAENAQPTAADKKPEAAAQGGKNAKGAKPPHPSKIAPRRSVRLILDDMPGASRPVGVQPIPLPSQHAVPAPVLTIPGPTTFIPSGCQGAGCTDPHGNRYQGGVGTTLIGPQGRLCSHNGITVQCF